MRQTGAGALEGEQFALRCGDVAKFTAHSGVEDSLVTDGAIGIISVAPLRLST